MLLTMFSYVCVHYRLFAFCSMITILKEAIKIYFMMLVRLFYSRTCFYYLNYYCLKICQASLLLVSTQVQQWLRQDFYVNFYLVSFYFLYFKSLLALVLHSYLLFVSMGQSYYDNHLSDRYRFSLVTLMASVYLVAAFMKVLFSQLNYFLIAFTSLFSSFHLLQTLWLKT